MERELLIESVNISLSKGTTKQPVESAEFNHLGVEGDAHSGEWHRQISLLSRESIDEFSLKSGREYKPGEFAENITLSGMRMNECRPGDIIEGCGVKMLVTQIGKKCHGGGCAIYVESGACVMPKEGIFTKVLTGGVLRKGDILIYKPKVFKSAVITLSSRAYNGVYPDKSGPEISALLDSYMNKINRKVDIEYHLIPDNKEMLNSLIKDMTERSFDSIFTTGGTGVGPFDFTPDVVRELLDIEIPGIMEHIRVKYGAGNPNALLSRSIAGIRANTAIFTLPGSVNGVREYMAEISRHLEHLYYMRTGLDTH